MQRRWQRFVRGAFALALTLSVLGGCASDEDSMFEVQSGPHTDASSTGTGGAADEGTCDPDFCPIVGPGAPCCITTKGPCGMDNGNGCQQLVSNDS